MKSIHPFRLSAILTSIFLSVVLLTNCTSSKNTLGSNSEKITQDPTVVRPNEDHITSMSWADLLRQVPGVSVSGSEPYLSVRVRGASSLNLTSEPLFILDEVPMGHNFSAVGLTVDPQHVKSIRVLKGPDATIYGARGANGVIVIRRK